MTALMNTPPFGTFEEASREVLSALHDLLGFELWMMTRTEGDNWIVLHAEDHGYNVTDGTVLRWSDSFCSRMVLGEGPFIAPDANAIAVYANAPIGQQVPIGAYVGVPINRKDGSLFGTLCAISPDAKSAEISKYLSTIQAYGRLLATILEQELTAVEQARALSEAQVSAKTDALTQLPNRRAWDERLAHEEARAKRYGDALCVVMVDVNDMKEVNDSRGHAAGDLLLQSCASILEKYTRNTDFVARIGGDEFAMILCNITYDEAQSLVEYIQEMMRGAFVNAAFGTAERQHDSSLFDAIDVADKRMYEHKARQKTQS